MAVDLKSRAPSLSLTCALAVLAVFNFSTNLPAQTSSTPAQKPCTSPCPAQDPPAKSTGSQFPFPGEDSKSAETNAPTSNTPDAPAPAPQPGNSTRQTPAPTSSSPFPFPGDPAPVDSSSSSSSSSSSPSAGADPDPDKPPAADAEKSPRRRLPKVKKLQSDEDREAEDITVARFYRDRGNWNAAYLRSKDAVKHQPDDPDAHLLLAETAQKLEKRDEAIAEYSALLKLDASEDQLKTARKALARLNDPKK